MDSNYSWFVTTMSLPPWHEEMDNTTILLTLIRESETVNVSRVKITALALYLADIYLHCLVSGSIGLFGTVSNVINIMVFHRLGVNDSMGVGLIALSLSDFFVSVIIFLTPIFHIWNLVLPEDDVDPIAVHYVTIGWWRDIFFLSSSWITTYLSIERCVCVVFPFRVKDIFTKFRAAIVVTLIFIVHAAIYMPVLVSMWLEWSDVEVQTANGTVLKDRLLIQYSENRHEIMLYMDIANGAVLPIPSQTLVVISVLWMIYGLKVSSRIRQSNTVSGSEVDLSKTKSNLSNKEKRLVKVVLFIAIILILCNIPRYIAVYARQIYPAMYFRNPNEHLYTFLWIIVTFFNSINSSVNIFVYLVVNGSFRQKFKEMFIKSVYK